MLLSSGSSDNSSGNYFLNESRSNSYSNFTPLSSPTLSRSPTTENRSITLVASQKLDINFSDGLSIPNFAKNIQEDKVIAHGTSKKVYKIQKGKTSQELVKKLLKYLNIEDHNKIPDEMLKRTFSSTDEILQVYKLFSFKLVKKFNKFLKNSKQSNKNLNKVLTLLRNAGLEEPISNEKLVSTISDILKQNKQEEIEILQKFIVHYLVKFQPQPLGFLLSEKNPATLAELSKQEWQSNFLLRSHLEKTKQLSTPAKKPSFLNFLSKKNPRASFSFSTQNTENQAKKFPTTEVQEWKQYLVQSAMIQGSNGSSLGIKYRLGSLDKIPRNNLNGHLVRDGFLCIAKALYYLHDLLGLIHGDIAARNFLVELKLIPLPNNQCRLSLELALSDWTSLTKADENKKGRFPANWQHAIRGTAPESLKKFNNDLRHLSDEDLNTEDPEKIKNQHFVVSDKTDMWALGLAMIEVITDLPNEKLRNFFDFEPPHIQIQNSAKDAEKNPDGVNQYMVGCINNFNQNKLIPQEVVNLLQRMFHNNPNNRISFYELIEAIKKLETENIPFFQEPTRIHKEES